MEIKINNEWRKSLGDYLVDEDCKHLMRLVKDKYRSNVVLPEPKNIFRALNLTPPESVRVVIVGQDPYSRKGEADGLSFSVNKGFKIPAGLRNIFKEVEREYGVEPLALTKHKGKLTCWAKQGVLLLNSILTVEEGRPGSHTNIGWENFTDEIIRTISDKGGVVFMLWGAKAKRKKELIDPESNLILEANHPSQPSRYSVFTGNGHFTKANEWLKSKGLDEIVW